MTLRTLRDAVRNISPPWLRRGNAEKVLYVLGYHLDALIDMAVAGVKTRLPGYYSDESIPFLARDRRMTQGRSETVAGFAARLLTWLDAHAHRGGALMLLQQLHAHFAPNNFPIELIYASGRRYSMTAEGVITFDTVTWTPPGDPAKWARWWLFYHHPPFAISDNWNDPGKTWNNGQVWNSGLSAADVADLKLIPDAWNAAHAFGRIVLLDEGEQWDSYDPGAWPHQLALSITMTDPLVPVSQNDNDTVVPPESGLPVAAEVVALAFQKVVNTLRWLTDRSGVQVVEIVGPDYTDPASVTTIELADYTKYSSCRILVVPAGGSGAGGDTDHSGGAGGSGFPVQDVIRIDPAVTLTLTIGPPGEPDFGTGHAGADTTVEGTNGYILVGRGGLNGQSENGGAGGNGGGGGRTSNGMGSAGGRALSNGDNGSFTGGLGIGDALPGSTGTFISPSGSSFLGGQDPTTGYMSGGGGGGGFWKRDTGNAVASQRMLSGIGYGAGGNGGKSDGGVGGISQQGRRAIVVLIFEGAGSAP